MKTVVILYNLNRKSNEFEAEFDSQETISFLKDCIKEKYKVKLIEADRKFEWVNLIQSAEPDIVFNVAEGFYGPARESVYTAILEQLKIPYCGPDSTNLLICLNKYLCKELIQKSDSKVNMPRHLIIRKISEIDKLSEIDFFPVFVKLNSEGSSIGISDKSVNDRKNIRRYVKELWSKYKRSILVEEYLDGYDLSMSYVDDIGVCGPSSISYQKDKEFYDYELKTTRDNEVIIEKDKIGKEIKNTLNAYTRSIVKILDIHGYAKLDFRVKKGKVYFLEINGQISFHPHGEFLTAFDESNCTKREVVLKIIENSLIPRSFSVGYSKR